MLTKNKPFSVLRMSYLEFLGTFWTIFVSYYIFSYSYLVFFYCLGENCSNVGGKNKQRVAIWTGSESGAAAGSIEESNTTEGSLGKSASYRSCQKDQLEQRPNTSLHSGQNLDPVRDGKQCER